MIKNGKNPNIWEKSGKISLNHFIFQEKIKEQKNYQHKKLSS